MRALNKLSLLNSNPMIAQVYKSMKTPLTPLFFLFLTACNASDNTVSESAIADQIAQSQTSSVDSNNSQEVLSDEAASEIGDLPLSNATTLASPTASDTVSEPTPLIAFTEAIATPPENSNSSDETSDASDNQTNTVEEDLTNLTSQNDPITPTPIVADTPVTTPTPIATATPDATGTPAATTIPAATSTPIATVAATPAATENEILSGAVYPFEKVNFQIANSIEFIKILYRDSLTAQEVAQPSFKNSQGEFTILAIPLTMEGVNTYEVSNDAEYLGKVDILTNSVTARSNNPGQYSLTVLNSLLNGLKDELVLFTEAALDGRNNSIENSLFDNIVPVQQAISNFQVLIDVLDQSVSGNGSIVDPSTNQLVVDEAGLETLDGLFHHIVTRYSTDTAFSSYALEQIQKTLQSGGSSFNLIFAAAGFQLSNWDGIAALASLEMYSTNSIQYPELDSLNQVLDIVKAGLFPAIVANELRNIRTGNDQTNIAEALRLFTKVELESQQESNYIFEEALTTLETMATELTNP